MSTNISEWKSGTNRENDLANTEIRIAGYTVSLRLHSTLIAGKNSGERRRPFVIERQSPSLNVLRFWAPSVRFSSLNRFAVFFMNDISATANTEGAIQVLGLRNVIFLEIGPPATPQFALRNTWMAPKSRGRASGKIDSFATTSA